MREHYKSKGRSWIKVWVGEWLDGTTRYEMTGAQRAFWVDLLAMAGRSRVPGVVCAGDEAGSLFGYPISRFQGILGDDTVDVLETLRMFESQGKISMQVTRDSDPKLYAVTIISWQKYQSEYMRQQASRKSKARQGADNVTPKSTPRCAIEGEVEEEGETEEENTNTIVETEIVSTSLGSKAMDAWNDNCGELPKINKMTRRRMAKLKQRLREDKKFIDILSKASAKASTVPFLCGRSDRGWMATFDWMLNNDTNATAVLEGKYDGGKGAESPAQSRARKNAETLGFRPQVPDDGGSSF